MKKQTKFFNSHGSKFIRQSQGFDKINITCQSLKILSMNSIKFLLLFFKNKITSLIMQHS